MVEVLTTSSSPTNVGCAWGSGLDEYIWVAGYSGINQTGACTTTDYSGLTVGFPAITGASETIPLPYTASAIASQVVNYVDVAVGVYPVIAHYLFSESRMALED